MVGQPCWRLNIPQAATIRAHAVGRTVHGLGGVSNIVGVEDCRIDEGGYAARRRHADLGKARLALRVAAEIAVRHDCPPKEPPVK